MLGQGAHAIKLCFHLGKILLSDRNSLTSHIADHVPHLVVSKWSPVINWHYQSLNFVVFL